MVCKHDSVELCGSYKSGEARKVCLRYLSPFLYGDAFEQINGKNLVNMLQLDGHRCLHVTECIRNIMFVYRNWRYLVM